MKHPELPSRTYKETDTPSPPEDIDEMSTRGP
jgi:hypothetical protein